MSATINTLDFISFLLERTEWQRESKHPSGGRQQYRDAALRPAPDGQLRYDVVKDDLSPARLGHMTLAVKQEVTHDLYQSEVERQNARLEKYEEIILILFNRKHKHNSMQINYYFYHLKLFTEISKKNVLAKCSFSIG